MELQTGFRLLTGFILEKLAEQVLMYIVVARIREMEAAR